MTLYTPRPWNDDDRDTRDYISYYSVNYEEYVPVYKIMKEYLDEEKAKIYNIDTSKNIANAFENMWEELWENSSVCSSNFSGDYSRSDNLNDYIDEEDALSSPMMSDTENDDVVEDKPNENADETIEKTSKFIYM